MALLFMESFDHFVYADLLEKWATIASAAISSGNGRRSSGSFRVTGTSDSYAVTRILTPVNTTAIVGVAFKVTNLSDIVGVNVMSGGTIQLGLKITGAGAISAMRGGYFGTEIGISATGVIAAATFYYLELKTVIHPSAGSVVVRVNGTTVLTVATANTAQTESASWNSIRLQGGGPTNTDYDDVYVCDSSGSAPWADFLGDSRVDARFSTAPGATTGWTPSTGANWQNVDEVAPNDDTDYNSAASSLTDTFVVQDAPVSGATIFGVQHCISMKKTDAGSCAVAPVIRHSGVDYVGTVINPGTAYAYGLQIAAVNPGTGAAWTEAGFNAAEFGYKRVS